MDKLETYRTLIKKILTEDAKADTSQETIETLLVFDEERESYQLMYIGWNRHMRTHGALLHLRLRNGKIWIEYDGTEEGVAQALLDAGVPKEDIVLAFHAEWKRKLTDFAVA